MGASVGDLPLGRAGSRLKAKRTFLFTEAESHAAFGRPWRASAGRRQDVRNGAWPSCCCVAADCVPKNCSA